MIINNIYDVSILIDEIDILNDGNASEVTCSIEESIYDNIPVCKIMFISSAEFINECPIIDGTKVTISIKSKNLEIDETMCFRVIDMSILPTGNNMTFSVSCIIDFYELFRTPIKYSMNNNSSEIFKLVAKTNNLNNGMIYSTQDKQLWVPSECNLYQWMNYLTQHAWASQQSGFYWCLGKNMRFVFADIDRLIYESKNIFTFYAGDIRADDIKNKILRYKNMAINMNPGTENLFNKGYDGENNHFDLLSYSTIKTNANKIRAASEIVNINKELSTGLKKNMSQIDVGNHHKNFFLAEAQNRRVLSTYSTYVDLFCEYYMPIDISQVCTIIGTAYNSVNNATVKPINIKYIISKIITKITSSNVSMDVELCSQGYNGKSTKSY